MSFSLWLCMRHASSHHGTLRTLIVHGTTHTYCPPARASDPVTVPVDTKPNQTAAAFTNARTCPPLHMHGDAHPPSEWMNEWCQGAEATGQRAEASGQSPVGRARWAEPSGQRPPGSSTQKLSIGTCVAFGEGCVWLHGSRSSAVFKADHPCYLLR